MTQIYTLEPFGEQGPQAERFLRVFNKLVQDPAVVAVFRRHYKLAKESAKGPRA
jgi:hypothetical protein